MCKISHFRKSDTNFHRIKRLENIFVSECVELNLKKLSVEVFSYLESVFTQCPTYQ